MEKLFSQFSNISKKEWLSQIEKESGSSILDLEINFDTNIKVSPFLNFEDKKLIGIPNQKSNNSWLVSEKVFEKEPILINKSVLVALNGGASAIEIEIYQQWNYEDFVEAFNSVFLEFIYIKFNFKNTEINIFDFFTEFKKYVLETKQTPELIYGEISENENFKIDQQIEILKLFPLFKIKQISITLIESISDQLTVQLIKAESYLASYGIEQIQSLSNAITFEICLSNNFYLSIATIRALKILWANVLKAYNLFPNNFIKVSINSNNDNNENTAVIAATSQCISAAIGGADLVHIAPFNYDKSKYGDEFAIRLARNIQNVLQLEGFLDKVVDPAAGSYYIDNLTESIVNEVWGKFKNKNI